MSNSGKLFRVSLTGQEVWDSYLKSFPPDYDPIFRDPLSTNHNCNHCKSFIRRYGNIVSIGENYNITTMFDLEGVDPEYFNTCQELTKLIKASKVTEVFFETFDSLKSLPYESCKKTNEVFQLGIVCNHKKYTEDEVRMYGGVEEGKIYTFNHMNLSINKKFVDFTGNSVESIIAKYRDDKNVFKRSMDEISLDTLHLVRDLINQGSLMNGPTFIEKVEKIIKLKKEYDILSIDSRDNWCWVKSYKFELAKFRNELIGTLCAELSEGKEINAACLSFNMRVDPINYNKAKSPITQRQIENAKKFVEENGYTESFNRRFATLKDIKISEILHINNGKGEIKSVSIFDNVKSTSTRHKRSEFNGIEEVHIDKFMKDILPNCTSVEAFLTNQHEANLVTLTTANIKDSKPICKWPNNYSWTYKGNIAGKSEIKAAVKEKGGKIDGVLRFSITWNQDGKDVLDFDAHASEPNGDHIYYASFKKGNSNPKTKMSGQLDVDMIRPSSLGVENIVWDNLSKMKPGKYKFWIKNFDGGRNKGFKAEIEFNDEIYTYEYNNSVGDGKDVHIAEVTLKDGIFSINHLIPESEVSSREIYGLETGKFHKVNLMCLSPNHWDEHAIGNKHYFFMLEGCKTPISIRSFHIENLISELLEHRKVLEVLGETYMIEPSDDQLSGLGFNATVRDSLVLKLEGTHKRTIKVIF